MSLKEHFKTTFDEEVSGLEENLDRVKGALVALENIDFDNSNYTVYIGPDRKHEWRAKSMSVGCVGSIEYAIEMAEQKFEEENKRVDNILISYDVHVRVGDECYEIPRKFWEKYVKYQTAYTEYDNPHNKPTYTSHA